MSDNPKILIIPIDNRPVCYDLCKQSADIFNKAEIFMPDINTLGGLKSVADICTIREWAKNIIEQNNIDVAILALDTIAYGGLISSRKTTDSFDKIKDNIDKFVDIFKSAKKKIKIYAVSSIMRISDNNINEEEKGYWDSYGKLLFRFSYLSHMLLNNYDVELEAELMKLAKIIPFEVIDDYLNTRKRNFDINNYYLDLVKSDIIEKIVFSQDDTAKYGLNVEEKELLINQAKQESISDKVVIKTGADEMILSLLSRAFVEFYGEKIKINVKFFDENSKNIISRYEDVSVQQSAEAAISLCGGEISSDFDIELLINAPNKIQNDLCLEILEDEISDNQSEKLIDYLKNNNNKYILADVKNANGADNYLIDKFLQIPFNDYIFYGFGAWNTTGNTLGTVVAIAIIKYLAQKYNAYDENAFKKTQYVRLLDDWAYQANVRKVLRSNGNTDNVTQEMQPYKEKTEAWLDYNCDSTVYSFPWNRTFEIKISVTARQNKSDD